MIQEIEINPNIIKQKPSYLLWFLILVSAGWCVAAPFAKKIAWKHLIENEKEGSFGIKETQFYNKDGLMVASIPGDGNIQGDDGPYTKKIIWYDGIVKTIEGSTSGAPYYTIGSGGDLYEVKE